MSYLYRFYGNPEYAFDVLKNKRIALVRPALFNDPFDPSFEFLTECNGSRDKFLYFVEKNHFTEFNQWIQSALTLAEWKRMLDIFENTLRSVKNNAFFCSFSKGESYQHIEKNHYMWGHYANGFRGVCFEFNEKELGASVGGPEVEIIFTSMNYVNEKLKISNQSLFELVCAIKEHKNKDKFLDAMDNTGFHEEHNNMLFQKSRQWQEENEWRLSKTNDDVNVDVIYEPIQVDAISAIYLGCRYNKGEHPRYDIVECARKNFPNAKIYDAKLVRGEFRLEFHEIG